jgi:hypothetical protein
MPNLPGGQIIGGMGGHIFVGDHATHYQDFFNQGGNNPGQGGSVDGFIEVAQWTIAAERLLAECPHTGTFGAISRRFVAEDWRFSCALPLDQEHPPDILLTVDVNVSLAFYLGDVSINPEAQAMGMVQSFYWTPAALLRHTQPVLNAAGDVIRVNCTGEGNGLLFLIPDESSSADDYIAYLQNRGQWT